MLGSSSEGAEAQQRPSTGTTLLPAGAKNVADQTAAPVSSTSTGSRHMSKCPALPAEQAEMPLSPRPFRRAAQINTKRNANVAALPRLEDRQESVQQLRSVSPAQGSGPAPEGSPAAYSAPDIPPSSLQAVVTADSLAPPAASVSAETGNAQAAQLLAVAAQPEAEDPTNKCNANSHSWADATAEPAPPAPRQHTSRATTYPSFAPMAQTIHHLQRPCGTTPAQIAHVSQTSTDAASATTVRLPERLQKTPDLLLDNVRQRYGTTLTF